MLFPVLGVLFFSTAFAIVFAYWQTVLLRRAKSELELNKQQIHLRERKIQTILHNAPIVFSAIDLNGIFLTSEGKGLEKLGRKANQSVGLSIYEMHSRNPIILDAVSKAFSGEHVATAFVLNGISYELYVGPEKDEAGNVIGASMLSVDITDRKRVEDEKAQLLIREQAAQETSKQKSEFLANMSHEIRTPLNGVLGIASLLADSPLNQEQKEFVQAIKQSGSGLLTVINDILDFSKIVACKLDFEMIDFELRSVIRNSLKGLHVIAESKGIGLTCDIHESLPLWLKGDPGRLRQILNNLIGNAIKFTERGQVSVLVSAGLSSEASAISRIRFEVQDTGIGITKAVLEKMFVPFSQADASMSRRYGGTGLGLSISKQLAEAMGGEIGVTSREGRGSTFWFVLPFEQGSSDIGAPAEPLHASDLRYMQADIPMVLVAEDHPVNQMITTRMLQKMGLKSQIAVDGNEALAALESDVVYDLVLMDCQMPNMDGLEATRLFRASTSERNRGVPILAMTANAMKGDREKCLSAGMNGYISKPITYEKLAFTVHQWLELRRKVDPAA